MSHVSASVSKTFLKQLKIVFLKKSIDEEASLTNFTLVEKMVTATHFPVPKLVTNIYYYESLWSWFIKWTLTSFQNENLRYARDTQD